MEDDHATFKPRLPRAIKQTWAAHLPPYEIYFNLHLGTDNTVTGWAVYTSDSTYQCNVTGNVAASGKSGNQAFTFSFVVTRRDGSQEKFETDRSDLGINDGGFGYFHGSWNNQFEFSGIAIAGVARH